MTFALYCHSNRRVGTEPLSLVFGYAMEVAVGSGDTVRMTESDITDERESGNSIRVSGA